MQHDNTKKPPKTSITQRLWTYEKYFSIPLTKLLTPIKQWLQRYCEIAYIRSGISQRWILKILTSYSPNGNRIKSILFLSFLTFQTTIPHQKLKKARNYHTKLFYSQKLKSLISKIEKVPRGIHGEKWKHICQFAKKPFFEGTVGFE